MAKGSEMMRIVNLLIAIAPNANSFPKLTSQADATASAHL